MWYWDVFQYWGYPSLALGAFQRVRYCLSEYPRWEKGFDVTSHGNMLLEVAVSNEKMCWQRHVFKCLCFFTVSLLKGTHNCNSFSFGFEWIFLLADKAARPPPVAPLRGEWCSLSLLPSCWSASQSLSRTGIPNAKAQLAICSLKNELLCR